MAAFLIIFLTIVNSLVWGVFGWLAHELWGDHAA